MYNSFRKMVCRTGVITGWETQPVLTYRMVEQVLMELRGCYPQSFGFDQGENVLRQVAMRMNVDPVTYIEAKKESYSHQVGAQAGGEQSFAEWLAYV